jgi:hypothetical protein
MAGVAAGIAAATASARRRHVEADEREDGST